MQTAKNNIPIPPVYSLVFITASVKAKRETSGKQSHEIEIERDKGGEKKEDLKREGKRRASTAGSPITLFSRFSCPRRLLCIKVISERDMKIPPNKRAELR